MKEKKKSYYQVTNMDGKTAYFTHCSNIRVENEDFYYLYNSENNSMLILKKPEQPLHYYLKKGELVILYYEKWKESENSISCIMLSGLDEFSYQVNRVLVGKEE